MLTAIESWVELSSQPSSSSLSSVADEIVTTGLHVSGPYYRRRRMQPTARSVPFEQSTFHANETSSQEEEEESESEDEHVLSSSAENIHSSERELADDSDADSDDGDNATTLGQATDPSVFRPQPNAFSHPLGQRSMSQNAAYPPHPHSEFRRSSFSHRSQPRTHRGGPSFMSPSVREDNDAALRASLTTLLSCAAAARGLPKTEEEAIRQRNVRGAVRPSTQPVELQLVPETDLLAEPEQRKQVSAAASPRRSSPNRSRTRHVADKTKRSGSAGRSPRATKKKRTVTVTDDAASVSPTLLTWVVSAGVVVLVSVVGFGAGYVIGREVGRQEAQEALAASVGGVNDTAGREVIRSSGSGLRRLRWGSVGKSIVAQA